MASITTAPAESLTTETATPSEPHYVARQEATFWLWATLLGAPMLLLYLIFSRA
ncbi:MAG: hypothetical protein VKJ06_06565 [Vampirovibrionales bacterium]|nr:hypothetical protein [Vampirovibrionales bacterium]